MNVTPTEILELFAEAARLGHRAPRLRSADGWLFRRQPTGRTLPEAPARPVGLFVFELSAREAAMGIRRPLTLHVPALPTSVERRCACGGYWERRQGLEKLVHVGRAVRDVCGRPTPRSSPGTPVPSLIG